jgi:tetratricopeptide (TPR) repeat protein
MNLFRVFFGILFAGFIGSSFVAAQQQKTAAELLADGDQYSEKLFDDQKALQSFQAALVLAPNDYEILWRLSRTYADIGEHMPHATDTEKQKQLEAYDRSLEFAKKAIATNANGSMGYVRRAITNGRIALYRGVWESIDLVKQVKADCEKSIQLDPNNAAAYYVLARSHAKVCEKPKMIRWPLGLGWANMDTALYNFEKSIALRPNFAMYRLDCAKAYIEEDEYDKAKLHLRVIPTLPKANEDDEKFKQEAAQLLEKIKDK